MKLRMAENSLFAILLRKPWWISILIAALLVVAAMAVLPRQYGAYAIAAGLPFLVIGAIAAWRQAQSPRPARVVQVQAALEAMNWREFSAAIDQSYRLRGYEVQALRESGADFLLIRGHQRAVVACKRWKAASHGGQALRDLCTAGGKAEAGERIYIALHPLSDNARRCAREQRIEVLQGTDLVRLLDPVLPR